jgi:hypothetical protein
MSEHIDFNRMHIFLRWIGTPCVREKVANWVKDDANRVLDLKHFERFRHLYWI